MINPPYLGCATDDRKSRQRLDNRYVIGYVYPQSGPAGLYGPSCETCAQLAIERINREGGIQGREVELLPIDGGRDDPSEIAAEVGQLVSRRLVDAVTGWHISAVRNAIGCIIRGRVPYVYAALHEGGKMSPDIVYAGEHPTMQIGPALQWLHGELALSRWIIVGNDYVWPKITARFVHRYAREHGLVIDSEYFVPLNTEDFTPVISSIAERPTGGVLMLLVGQDAVAFNRAFCRSGLHRDVPRFSPIIEENALLANEPEANDNLYVSAGYFDSLTTTAALDFVDSYYLRFGTTTSVPRLNSIGESCYEALLLLRELLRKPDSDDRIAYESPRGDIALNSNQVRQDIYIARAAGYDFDVMCQLSP